MPKGNPGNPGLPRIARRRSTLLLVILGLFALGTLFFTLPDAIPSGPSLSKTIADNKLGIKNPLNSFRSKTAHPPPTQKNSTDGESFWHVDWNWLRPFSSSVTKDEERALLPALATRPPIYCYYDPDPKMNEEVKDAESALLLTWRRAWWAQGFKPVILSSVEALENPLYKEVLLKENLDEGFKRDIIRWLAWDNMGGGILAHRLLFPMGPRQDPLLSFLRRGEYPSLTRWEELNDGIFIGDNNAVRDAITNALREPATASPKNIVSALSSDKFRVDPSHGPLAFYDATVIEKRYSKVGDQIKTSRALGLQSLDYLINAHLHTAWQNVHKEGLAVLQPIPAHTTYMVKPAQRLASMLATCADTPMPGLCPPNMPKCTPCDPAHPMKIQTLPSFENTTRMYTIGTVPHPYTIQSLANLRDSMTVPWIRRDTRRDMWLAEVLDKLLGKDVSGAPRLVKFKEAVAGEFATAASLWLVAEREYYTHELDWWFGFEIPRKSGTGEDEADKSKSKSLSESSHAKSRPAVTDVDLTEEALEREPVLLKKARAIGHSSSPQDLSVRNAIEAWNLADTEAWRFTKAFLARSRKERQDWDEQESRYSGSTGSDKQVMSKSKAKSSWVTWGDRD